MIPTLSPVAFFVVGDAVFNLLLVFELREFLLVGNFLSFQFEDDFLFNHSVTSLKLDLDIIRPSTLR